MRITYLLLLLQVSHVSTKYMSNFLSIRAGPDNDLQLEGINDTRNGLLLHLIVHHLLGNGDVAFLKASLVPFR